MSCITKLLESGAKTVRKDADTYVDGGGEYKGYEYLIVLTSMGHRCGYVAINDNHPLYAEEDYSGKIADLEMHGGCTFYDKQFTDSDCTDKWIGFDCAHSGDLPDIDALMEYDKNGALEREKRQNKYRSWDGIVCSKKYVERECMAVIDQLVAS